MSVLEIHTIQSVPVANLNRNDIGQPKSFLIGGCPRTIISSQSQKYAIRQKLMTEDANNEFGIRTKLVPQLIADKVLEKDHTIAPKDAKSWAESVGNTISSLANGKTDESEENIETDDIADKKKSKTKNDSCKKLQTSAFISRAEIDAIAEKICESKNALTSSDIKKITQIVQDKMAPDIRLFGRMMASAPTMNQDGVTQIAYGFSTHPTKMETDYFITSDDLAVSTGAAHLGNKFLNSYTMYRYGNIDLSRWINEAPDKEKAVAQLVEFVKAFCETLPSGYQNSCAQHGMPALVYLDIRNDQPVNMSNAFERPVESKTGYEEDSCQRFTDHIEKVYANITERPVWESLSTIHDLELSDELKDRKNGLHSQLDELKTVIPQQV